ncbi:MAG TPA: hypothetical protein VJU77_01640 [Chthoniobacterales bacterium]|nr:hypothetical protein [Chthoniobacterales bacterium]
MRSALTILLCLLMSARFAFGGGSVEWNFHALPILKKNPDLLKIITDSLDVAPTGNGVRLGKDAGEREGSRVPPFEFPARLKGASGPYTFTLVIHDSETNPGNRENKPWIELRPN